MSLAVRPAAVAGMFYPADAPTLAREVDRLLGSVPQADAGRPPKMLVVPHAGYAYSGAVAACAYALLAPWRERIRRVVLLGPAHRVALRGLALPGCAAFETPLGRVAVDTTAMARLAGLPQARLHDGAHADEHALEVQLPFLQRALGTGFAVVPLVVGAASASDVRDVVERLWGGSETLIVVSTDLSHYLSYDHARATDRATVDAILRLDPAIAPERACGAVPLSGALLAARAHGMVARVLDLRNSGDTAGDRARVVGYAALAFEPAADAAAPDATEGRRAPDPVLRDALIGRARNAIARALALPVAAAEPQHPALRMPAATFVTLRVGGALRGCVGTLRATQSLQDDVRAHAVAAAFDDTRFAPLTAAEFDRLAVEVSVLDPAEPLAVADEESARRALRPGVDGVILEWHGHRATFLPQVWEQLPRAADFLAALKDKAGLPRAFWADDLRLARYTVRKFVEVRP